jgi:hypothetical protein
MECVAKSDHIERRASKIRMVESAVEIAERAFYLKGKRTTSTFNISHWTRLQKIYAIESNPAC